jgi:phosphotransacetylase
VAAGKARSLMCGVTKTGEATVKTEVKTYPKTNGSSVYKATLKKRTIV